MTKDDRDLDKIQQQFSHQQQYRYKVTGMLSRVRIPIARQINKFWSPNRIVKNP